MSRKAFCVFCIQSIEQTVEEQMRIASVFVGMLIECIGENAVAIKISVSSAKKQNSMRDKKYIQVMNVLF